MTKKIIRTLPTTTPNTAIEVELYYEKGGLNYFQGIQRPRGYYLSATPITRERGVMSFTAFSGAGLCLEPAKRFSQKHFDAIQPTEADIQKLVNAVLAKSKGKYVLAANPP